MILVIANKLTFIPMCVDRFIHIAFPFSYKRIITTKVITTTIITLWIIAIVIAISLYFDPHEFYYIPSLGTCRWKQSNTPMLLILLLCFSMPIVLITITSIYLRYRIIKSKNFFHSVKRDAAQERKSNKVGRLAEILQEQVKPTLAVFRVGGIHAVLDTLTASTAAATNFFAPSSITAFIITVQLMVIFIQYLQSANYALIYNIITREKMIKMIGCKRVKNTCSKVIVLHRDYSHYINTRYYKLYFCACLWGQVFVCVCAYFIYFI